MKTKRKHIYLDDFDHRLLVACLVTARNEYQSEEKPLEDVDELILKIIDAPTKKHGNLQVIVECDSEEELEQTFNKLHKAGYKCRMAEG